MTPSEPNQLLGPAWVSSDVEEFQNKLKLSRPLRVKYGIDPTSPHVHLGHTVPLRVLRRFQDAGHEVHIIIGDTTAMVGDPSGRNVVRPVLDVDAIEKNKQNYLHQIGKIIDLDLAIVHENSDWFSRMGIQELIALLQSMTVQFALTRQDFRKRIDGNVPIYCHELLYPLLQARDSVEIMADVEIGGTEQLFTLMLARELQKDAGLTPQSCIVVPILRGLDGQQRMGKSLKNYIGVDESDDSIYAKTMSIPDSLLEEWYQLLTELPWDSGCDPMQAKEALALEMVRIYGDNPEQAQSNWRRQFRERLDPENLPEVLVVEDELPIIDLLIRCNLASTRSEARRQIDPDRSVTIGENRRRVLNYGEIVPIIDGTVLRVGRRRIVRIRTPK